MWVRTVAPVVRTLSIAAALFTAPTTQPQAAAAKGATQGETTTSFATVLDAAIGANENQATNPAFSTLLVAPQAAVPAAAAPTQLTFADIAAGDVPADTGLNALANGTGSAAAGNGAQSQTAANVAPALTGTDTSTATPIPGANDSDLGASASPASAAIPAQAQAAQQAAGVTSAVAAATAQANPATDASGENGGDDTSDNATGSSSTATPPAASTASTAVNVAMTALNLGATSSGATATPADATTSSPLGSQPEAGPAAPADAQSADAPKADPKPQAQSIANSAQSPAQAQLKPHAAPSADVAMQAADITQPAPGAHAATADTLGAHTPTTDAARAQAAPPALQSAPAAALQVYSRIIERADGRAHRFEVRLDPAELGRVDVRIEIGADRKVHAVLAAHDSAALTDLMKGQRALERALSDAGIDLADKGVRFELASDNGRSGAQQGNGEGARSSSQNVWRNFDVTPVPVSAEAASVASQPAWRTQRYDLVA